MERPTPFMRNFLVTLAAIVSLSGTPIGWLVGQVHDLDTRVVVIENTRFTNEDGKRIEDRITALVERVAMLPKETPPAWFKERVDRLEVLLEQLRESVIRLENKVVNK